MCFIFFFDRSQTISCRKIATGVVRKQIGVARGRETISVPTNICVADVVLTYTFLTIAIRSTF